MILKEKIQTIIVNDYGNLQKILLLEKIAEDYAIEFAQWVQFHSELWIKYKTSELLEIFKKEKGL